MEDIEQEADGNAAKGEHKQNHQGAQHQSVALFVQARPVGYHCKH